MKKIILLFAIFALSLASVAQTKPQTVKSKKTKSAQVAKKRKTVAKLAPASKEDFDKTNQINESLQVKKATTSYYVSLKKDQMIIFNDGKNTVMTGEIITADGTKIYPSGAFLRPNGYKAFLKDGESMDIPQPIEAPSQAAEFTKP